MAHERTCLVDRKKYEYCPRCEKYASMPYWYFNFCSENCKNIYDVVNKFAFGHIEVENAKDMLKDCDLSNLDCFNDEVKDYIEKINEVPKKVKRKKTTVAETSVVNEPVDDIVN